MGRDRARGRRRWPSTSPTGSATTARKRAITRVVKEVAFYLGNTPAVARGSYIDPRVFDRYRGGQTIKRSLDLIGVAPGATAIQGPVEEAVLDLLAPGRARAAQAVPSRARPIASTASSRVATIVKI